MKTSGNTTLKFANRIILTALCQLPVASCLWACPLCVESTPYKHGLQWAVLFLLPVPFVLAGTLFWWVRRFSQSQDEQS